MKISFQRLRLIQRILIGVVAFLVLAVGIYHCTHSGMGSGSVELACAFLLILALFLPRSAGGRQNRFGIIQIVLIGIVDFFALLFGIYHLTTPDGLRSGIIELIIFTILTSAIFLPFGSSNARY